MAGITDIYCETGLALPGGRSTGVETAHLRLARTSAPGTSGY